MPNLVNKKLDFGTIKKMATRPPGPFWVRGRAAGLFLGLGYAVQSFGGSRAGVGVVVQVYVELSSGLGDLEGSNRIHYAVEVFKIGAEDYEFH